MRLGISGVANKLGLHDNTVKRWIDSGNVPKDYCLDFARMLDIKISGKYADGIDQFFTKPVVAKECWETFHKVAGSLGVDLRNYHYIEPSAGCGWFLQLMPADRRTGIDITSCPGDKCVRELVQTDFLRWKPRKLRNNVVVGNPPFGLRGHLALQFVNHAATFADLVGFILPQLFESDGKGVPAKRVRNLRLAHTESLPPDSFEYPDGKPVTIHTVFQVWTRINFDRIRIPRPATCTKYIKVYSLSDGGTPASTRNKKMIGCCDLYLPSTCFGGMRAYNHFEALPNRRGYGVVVHRHKRKIIKLLKEHNWTATAFPSTNSALNLRSSLIEAVLVKSGYTD